MHSYQRVYEAIRSDIEHGHHASGSRLPPERLSASQYHVSRSTIRRAWQELEAMGYVTWADKATPVVIGNPEWPDRVGRSAVGRLAPEREPGFLSDLMQAAISPARYNFEIGTPDPDLLPVGDFQHILRELLSYASRDVFGYSPTAGLARVRQALREEYLARRGYFPKAEEILVTAGSLQGLDLLTRLWVRPDDIIAVENPTFAGALHIFRSHGARIVGIPIDEDGIRVDLLMERFDDRSKPRFLYVQPVAQNPTGISLSSSRRQALIEWAQETHVPVVEDDAYGFLVDTPPLASQAPDRAVYLNTLSKILAPGIRVGCLVAPQDVIRQLVSLKQLSDLHTSTLSQLLAEGWLRLGEVDIHIRRARTVYAARLKTALKLVDHLPLKPYARPTTGFYLFAQLPAGVLAAPLHHQAAQQELLFALGEPFGAQATDFPDWIRLAVNAHPQAQIETGLRRLARLIDTAAGSSGLR